MWKQAVHRRIPVLSCLSRDRLQVQGLRGFEKEEKKEVIL